MERTVFGVNQLLEFVLRDDKESMSAQQSRISKYFISLELLLVVFRTNL